MKLNRQSIAPTTASASLGVATPGDEPTSIFVPARRRPARAATVSLVLALALGFGVVLSVASAEPSSAWQQSNAAGSPGTVTNLSTAYAGDVYQTGTKLFTMWADTAPIVYRSPAAAGAQTVRLRYLLERWTGSTWAIAASSNVMTGGISSAQNGVRFQTAPRLTPQATTGYFRLSYAIDWSNAYGTVVASTFVTSNASSDHACGTVNPNRYCISYGNYVYVG